VIAVLAGRRWSHARVLAIDTSATAVAYATRNARRLAPNVEVVTGRLVEPVPPRLHGRVELMLSNVPYVSSMGGRDLGGWDPPPGTVFGMGPDGLGLMRQLAWQSRAILEKGALWVFQLADGQWEQWARELEELGFEPVTPARRRPGQALVAAAWWRG
jgi:methylase of polypeptide subunit release factors